MHIVQKGRDSYYEGLLTGHEPQQKLKTYRDADRRIHKTLLRFENMDAIDWEDLLAITKWTKSYITVFRKDLHVRNAREITQ